jgi:hypothetical protein
MILHVLIAMIAGWISRHQQHVIAYLQEENRVLKAQLGQRRLRLKDIATFAPPDTLMRWYHRLIAEKFDGSKTRKAHGRPRAPEEIEQLVVRVAEENPTWAIQGDRTILTRLWG